jgi:hypothetical protein
VMFVFERLDQLGQKVAELAPVRLPASKLPSSEPFLQPLSSLPALVPLRHFAQP